MANVKKIHIAEKIKRARKEAGLSQKDLALVLELSDKAVSSYEVGRATPSIQVLREISKVTYKPVGYFIDEAETDDVELHSKLQVIERELSEIKKLLAKRK
jgi:transcriptional regulator with XRE-family HTH domain